ncbi:MAG: hypothetical protein ACLP4V_32400 [Methylocella sp.]
MHDSASAKNSASAKAGNTHAAPPAKDPLVPEVRRLMEYGLSVLPIKMAVAENARSGKVPACTADFRQHHLSPGGGFGLRQPNGAEDSQNVASAHHFPTGAAE